MKRIFQHTISAAFVIMTLAACNDEFLERMPHDEMTDANFWQTETHVKSVANTFTSALQGKYWLNITEIMADSAPWAVTTAFRTIGAGNFTTETSQINSLWVTAYTGIGRVNYFLNNYHRADGKVDATVLARYAAEAYFYRAYNYWVLTTYFGDVPYITDELNVESPDVYRGRDKRATIIASITKDLEDHYEDLPEYISAGSAEFGRVSQCAALALLSRIYLYNEMYTEAVNAAGRAMNNSYHELYSTGNPDVDM